MEGKTIQRLARDADWLDSVADAVDAKNRRVTHYTIELRECAANMRTVVSELTQEA